MKRRIIAFVCALALLFALPANVCALSEKGLDTALSKTAQYCLSALPEPGEGGQWIVLALARGGFELPGGYLSTYEKNMKRYVKEKKGVLTSSKYTVYSGAVLGLTAAGADAANVGGYDLTEYLSDYDGVKRQGINGPVFALLAVDSGDYPCTSRTQYVDYILSRQLTDGGWAFSGDSADPDMTAMALQALARYQGRADVAAAVEKGVARLAKMQKSGGGYASYGVENAESTAQVILALCELGISVEDSRFVKGGKSLLDVLLTYQNRDGSFCHTLDGEGDSIATEQAFMAMVSARRQQNGESGIYNMKNVVSAAKFTDISGHWAEVDILFCVEQGLFQGTGEHTFTPEGTMDRAMVVTVLWRLAGEPAATGKSKFSDVSSTAYYAQAVRWASGQGIVKGYSDGTFGVRDSVTRQELSLLLYRYAEYRGMNVSASKGLGGYADASSVASWARTSMAWAAAEGLITGSSGGKLLPGENATRAQVAAILTRFVKGS